MRYIRYICEFPKEVAKKSATDPLHVAHDPLHFREAVRAFGSIAWKLRTAMFRQKPSTSWPLKFGIKTIDTPLAR